MTANTSQVNVLSYASTNVTSSAYTTLFVATPITVSKIQITDSSGSLLKIATGPVGSETDICAAPVSGSQIIPIYLIAGTRVAVKAVSASTVSTGYNILALLQ